MRKVSVTAMPHRFVPKSIDKRRPISTANIAIFSDFRKSPQIQYHMNGHFVKIAI
jgi:hypothetical protein